ncbi:MAG: TatD family hydrolase [Rikenellaceae bacterium]
MFIDTHAHLYVEQYDADCQEVIDRSREAGVGMVIMPDIDSHTRDAMFLLAEAHPSYLRTMVGVHPTCINDNPQWRSEISMVAEVLERGDAPSLCALGEVGLDLYWSRDFLAEQSEALRMQLELAIEYKLPIDVHVRDAWAEIIPILREYRGAIHGAIHAYSGGAEEYEIIRSIGDFKFGIGGVVTFKRSSLVAAVEAIPLEDILLETDAPYLTPTPHRGSRNEPAYIPLIAAKIAEIKGVDINEVARVTSDNARQVFGIEG